MAKKVVQARALKVGSVVMAISSDNGKQPIKIKISGIRAGAVGKPGKAFESIKDVLVAKAHKSMYDTEDKTITITGDILDGDGGEYRMRNVGGRFFESPAGKAPTDKMSFVPATDAVASEPAGETATAE